MIEDGAGNLYGTTFSGGTGEFGTAFELAPDGTETVLHSFTGGNGGGGPEAPLMMDETGNLYGTTVGGGRYGAGTVFRLTTGGSEKALFSFVDSAFPVDGVIARSGYLYGTTPGSGGWGYGSVFRIKK